MENISPHVFPPCLLKMLQALRNFLLPFCIIMQALNIHIIIYINLKKIKNKKYKYK